VRPSFWRFGIITVTFSICGVGAMAQSVPSGQDVVPLFTPALEQQLQPQCCQRTTPFTATYQQGRQRVVFVAVRHAFSTMNGTVRAVDSGFAAPSPAIVIVEGFPTAWGENPPPVLDKAHSRGGPEAGGYDRSEMMYTASSASSRGIPFLGGEPAAEKELQALGRRGYTAKDIAFDYLVEGLGQAVRAGDVTAGTGDPKFARAFSQSAERFIYRYSLVPLSFEEFPARYKSMFGVEFIKAGRTSVARNRFPARIIQSGRHERAGRTSIGNHREGADIEEARAGRVCRRSLDNAVASASEKTWKAGDYGVRQLRLFSAIVLKTLKPMGSTAAPTTGETGCIFDEMGNLVEPTERPRRGEQHCGERHYRVVVAGP
jgi:hypothetical protein